MKLLNIRLERFRNHAATGMDFPAGANVFLGENGEGKTNILEAISYLCLTKSFYAGADATVLQVGAGEFTVAGELESDLGIRYAVQAVYTGATSHKRFLVNKAPVERMASVVGQFPVVVLSPENSAVTFGGPVDRRRFIDLVISQSSSAYLEDLLEYRRVLRQRNKILFDGKIARSDCSGVIEPWDESLVTHGARIIRKRAQFIREFESYVTAAYAELAGSGETPSLTYEAGLGPGALESVSTVEAQFRAELAGRKPEERRLGSTLTGPHRDEISLKINDLELRKFASQGQHKSFLIALKLGEFHYLKDRCRETPLLLLDDVFSELDEHRTKHMLDMTRGLGQRFITTTDERVFPAGYDWGTDHRKYLIHRGTVRQVETSTYIHENAR